MLKKLLSVLFVFFLQVTFSQSKQLETCESSDETLLDLNSITKCTIDNSKDETSSLVSRKSKRLTIEVSSRRRVVRKRNAATSANSINASRRLESIRKESSLVNDLNLNKSIADKLPFDVVEQKPLFKKCESKSIIAQPKCFKEQVLKHVKRNIKYPQNSYNKNIQGTVLTQFVIDENGAITDIITRGPYLGSELEAEAKRIVNKLPKLQPGKINGNSVKVKYGIPISFKIPGKKRSNIKKKKENVFLNKVVNFANVDEIPLFKSCKRGNEDEKLDCFNNTLSKHLNRHFAYPEEAAANNIEGKIYVYFVIDKSGDIVNIKTRGPKNSDSLKKASKKLVEKLPKFTPAKHKGKPANVRYVIPINFRLN